MASLTEKHRQHFRERLELALPLQHIGQFYDEKKIQEEAWKEACQIIAEFNPDADNKIVVLQNLLSDIQEEVKQFSLKNQNHCIKSKNDMNALIKLNLKVYDAAVEFYLTLNPNPDFDTYSKYVEVEKTNALARLKLRQGWKENLKFQEEQEEKLRKKLNERDHRNEANGRAEQNGGIPDASGSNCPTSSAQATSNASSENDGQKLVVSKLSKRDGRWTAKTLQPNEDAGTPSDLAGMPQLSPATERSESVNCSPSNFSIVEPSSNSVASEEDYYSNADLPPEVQMNQFPPSKECVEEDKDGPSVSSPPPNFQANNSSRQNDYNREEGLEGNSEQMVRNDGGIEENDMEMEGNNGEIEENDGNMEGNDALVEGIGGVVEVLLDNEQDENYLSDRDDDDEPEIVTIKRKKYEKFEHKEIPSNIQIIPGNPERYHCTICPNPRPFKTKAQIENHRFCLKQEHELPYRCDECDIPFRNKRNYVYHRQTRHIQFI